MNPDPIFTTQEKAARDFLNMGLSSFKAALRRDPELEREVIVRTGKRRASVDVEALRRNRHRFRMIDKLDEPAQLRAARERRNRVQP